MKRLFAMLLIIAMLTPLLALTVCAASEQAEDVRENVLDDQMIALSCRYDAEKSRILVGGSIRHDVLVKHSDDTLEVFALSPTETIEDVLNHPERTPVASSAISVRFEFSIEAKTIAQKYARYCVALRSPDGQTLLVTESKYAGFSSSFHYNAGDRTGFKGIQTQNVSLAADAGAGRVILPVYLDRLPSTATGGILFRYFGESVYFDEDYIHALDLQVRSASASGAQVYLQWIKTGDDEADTYPLPDVYDEQTLFWIEAMTAFFCRRYADYQSGILDGIVVGKDIDRASFDSTQAYAKQYVLYLLAVANTARSLLPNVDIVLPFSENNGYEPNADAEQTNNPAQVLEAILAELDASLVDPFSCTTLIESDTLPLELSDEPSQMPDLDAPQSNETLHAANLSVYAEYLERLSHAYRSAPLAFTFVWSVGHDVSPAAIGAFYAYSYFRLLSLTRISSFAVSFYDREVLGDDDGFSALNHLFTYIDTAWCDRETEYLRNAFGISSWQELYGNSYAGPVVLRDLYENRATTELPTSVKGKFAFADFSAAVKTEGWFAGFGCEAIRLTYGQNGSRALQTELSIGTDNPAEVFWLYDYPENLIYTPYMVFELFLESEERGALYELTVTFGEGKDRQVSSVALRSGEESLVVLDLSSYNQAHMAQFCKISVRSLEGTQENVSLWLYDIYGYSTELDDDTLAEKIEQERARIRNLSQSDENNDWKDQLWMIVGIGVLVVAIGVGVFVCIRSGDDSAKERDGDESRNE